MLIHVDCESMIFALYLFFLAFLEYTCITFVLKKKEKKIFFQVAWDLGFRLAFLIHFSLPQNEAPDMIETARDKFKTKSENKILLIC